MVFPLEVVFGLAASSLSVPLLAAAARRAGWADDPASAPERKLQARAVPPVGGAAILLALVVERLARASAGREPGFAADERWLWAAFALAFAIGLIDDLAPRGLAPAAKLVGQTCAGLAFAAAVAARMHALDPLAFLAATFVAVLAQNLVNTWDNADGAAAALGVCGLCAGPVLGLGALLGFLPYNLPPGRAAAPRAYLGDSGSHLLALVLLASATQARPGAALVLWLPLLDLARLSWVRLRAGSRPWIGDRRHLAHRLQAAGLGRLAVVAALTLLTVPLAIGGWVPGTAAYGVLATTVLFAAVLYRTRGPRTAG